MDPQHAKDSLNGSVVQLDPSRNGAGIRVAPIAEQAGQSCLQLAPLGDELSAVARGLARELAAETALVVVWDEEVQIARVRAGWGFGEAPDELLFHQGAGFVGGLLGAEGPLLERLSSPSEPGLGDRGVPQVVTHAAGAPFCTAAEVSGAVCAGFSGPPIATADVVGRTASAYATVAGLLLEGSPLFSDLLAPAAVDMLTGVLNYAGLREALEREMQRSQRHGHRLTCCFVGLDGLREVNDRGRVEGNRVLGAAAGALRAGLRGSDSIGRYAGDEFVIFFPETQPALVFPVALRLREAIRSASAALGSPVDASFGVAEWRPDDSIDDLLGRADEVMLAGKRAGPGSFAADRSVSRRHRAVRHRSAGSSQRARRSHSGDSGPWDVLVEPNGRGNGQR